MAEPTKEPNYGWILRKTAPGLTHFGPDHSEGRARLSELLKLSFMRNDMLPNTIQ